MIWQVPEPHAVFDVTLEDGAQIRVRQHGERAGPRLYVSHGNGFAADAYLPFWSRLLDRFELMLFDFRNHGHNAQSDPARHNYPQMARDLERVYQDMTARLGRKTSVGVFHSMAGRAAMMHAIAGIVPPSPTPLAPIGLSGEATSTCSISTRGISGAVGKRYSP